MKIKDNPKITEIRMSEFYKLKERLDDKVTNASINEKYVEFSIPNNDPNLDEYDYFRINYLKSDAHTVKLIKHHIGDDDVCIYSYPDDLTIESNTSYTVLYSCYMDLEEANEYR